MASVSTTFCANSDVQKIMSQVGVSLRVDDDAAAAQWAREEATVDLQEYLGFRYTDSALTGSSWVTRKAAWIAAKYLCKRRQNPVPQSLADELESLFERLEEMRKGTRSVPGIMTRKADIPVLSNQRERLQPFPQAITERNRSTGDATEYTPFDDRYDWFDYSI